jgi:hypothetical protein
MMDALQNIIRIKEAVEKKYLGQPGVTGVDVGFKYVGGQRTDEIAIRILVEKKKKTVAKEEKVPDTIEGIKTDVIERTFELHQFANKMAVAEIEIQADTGTYTPVKGGISIGPCRVIGGFVYTGTLGTIVRDNATGNTLLLSNFHVMCVDTGWHVGDQMAQPSRVDTGSCPGSVVGTLLRASLTGTVDAAVCTLSGRSSACEIVDIGAVTGTATAVLNAPIRKRGRTTGLTYGFVDSVSLTVNVDYGDGIGLRTLSNQIGIRPDTSHNASFGEKGDSGSVVVDDSRRIVGLYFAGGGGFGVANPIAAVLTELNISVCTGLKPIKEFLKREKIEKIEIKEFKREKLEKIEKIEIKESFKEIKDRKPEKFEIEGGKNPLRDINKPRKENIETGPQIPNLPDNPIGRNLEDRLSQIEETLGQLSTFITGDMRPDLATGALSQESDLGDVETLRQQLEKAASDAMQAKLDFDNRT